MALVDRRRRNLDRLGPDARTSTYEDAEEKEAEGGHGGEEGSDEEQPADEEGGHGG